MFSYRHAFHAGNHADVLKHTVLVAIVRYLTQKDAALWVLDTHAGAGLYRLDGDYASTSAESSAGVLRLLEQARHSDQPLAPALQDYVALLHAFNGGAPDTPAKAAQPLRIYPGSPLLVQHVLRPQDRLKLFELHPTDARSLVGHVAQLEVGKQVQVLAEDGFTGLRQFLPPPSRRGLVLCDPSYEIKTDYGRVVDLLEEGLRRFATGVYAIWYPLIGRQEAHDLPRRLKAQAQRAGKPWLHASLTVKSAVPGPNQARPGLTASGMFVVNPPYTLHDQLASALPQMQQLLGQDRHANHVLESGGPR